MSSRLKSTRSTIIAGVIANIFFFFFFFSPGVVWRCSWSWASDVPFSAHFRQISDFKVVASVGAAGNLHRDLKGQSTLHHLQNQIDSLYLWAGGTHSATHDYCNLFYFGITQSWKVKKKKRKGSTLPPTVPGFLSATGLFLKSCWLHV